MLCAVPHEGTHVAVGVMVSARRPRITVSPITFDNVLHFVSTLPGGIAPTDLKHGM